MRTRLRPGDQLQWAMYITRLSLGLALLLAACDTGGSHCDCVGGDEAGIKPLCEAPARINANAGPDEVVAALTALRDHTPVSVDFMSSADGGFSGEAGFAYAPGDGTVFFVSRQVSDSYQFGLPIDHYELKDAAFFDACLAEADLNKRFLCLFEITGAGLGRCGE